MSTEQKQEISVCGVGKYRKIAIFASKQLEATPFRIAAFLDTTSPEPYKFTSERLALVLRSLYPAPRCFIAGEGIEAEVNAAAVQVWKEFVKECEVEDPLLINVSAPVMSSNIRY